MQPRLGARLLLCLTCALAFLAVPALTQQRGGGRNALERVGGKDVVAREVLVRFRGASSPAALADLATDSDADAVRPVGRAGVVRVRSRSLSAAALAARLAKRVDLLYVEPNYIVRASTTDPRFPEMWALENIGQAVNGGLPGTIGVDIGAVRAWEVTVGSTSHVVAVLDTGIDYLHPDLAANMWSAPIPFTVDLGSGLVVTCAAGTHGYNAITGTCDPMDDHSHGTHVAGTIGAVGDNALGVTGVNWTSQLMGVKFLDDTGSGTIADAVSAIRFVLETKRLFHSNADVRVLSASWGGSGFSQALLDEITSAAGEDVLFVAAAGNNGLDNDISPTYPASYDAPNIVAVAATDSTDQIAWFSNYGTASVHLGAPGVDILSTIPGGGYAYYSGTSMATPHVSGAAALVLSRCAFDTAHVKEALLGTARPVADLAGITITGGRLDVYSAVQSCVAAPDPPVLSAVGADRLATLSWSSMPGAIKYSVKRSQTAGGPYATIAPDVKGSQYTDSDLVNETTYYYVVSATNAVGTSADSNEASATPMVPADLVVSSLSVPGTSGIGSTIAISATVMNLGSGPAVATNTRFYLSLNSIADSSDVLLTSASVPPLSPGASVSLSLSTAIPANAPAGAQYVIAVADADNQAGESSESNNTRTAWVVVGPDLVLTAFNAPATATAGESFVFSDTVQNQGGGVAASSITTFYLSADTVIDASDVRLPGSRPVPSLAANASSSGSVAVAIPSSVSAGQWYLIAKADSAGAVAEAYEANNTYLRTIRIGTDLIVSLLSAPVKGGAGLALAISDTTLNQGSAITVPSITRFYLSVNTERDAGDSMIGSRVVPPLASGAASSATTTVTIPPGTPTGAYYLLAVADADGALVETFETNNLQARSIQVGGDVIVASVSAPASVGPGTSIVVTDTTTNQGGGSIGTTTTRYYFSTNSVLDAQDVVLGSRIVPALAAGASTSGSVTVTIPSGGASGSYFIIARADADDAEAEAAESNNVLARSILLGGDLTISSFSAPGKGGAGLSLVVSDTTVNSGAASVPATVTRFYLSSNTILDASDILLSGERLVPALGAAATSSGSTTVTLPATISAGFFYVIASADADGVAVETQEGNNTLSRLVQVGPDLIVSALSVPSKVAPGSTIGISATTANDGGGTAAPSITAFVLSTNSTLDAGDLVLAGSHPLGELLPAASSSAVTSVSIPAGVTAGSYYLFARADSAGGVIEASETNNTRWQFITVGPDLVVSAASLSSATVQAGTTVTATETVLNQGAGTAGPSITRFYLSGNSLVDVGDILLPGGRDVPEVAANSSSSGTTAITIPANTPPGTYFLLAAADGGLAVTESDEGNNARTARVIQVTTP